MRRLIIGDVHGCYAELQELLQRAALSAEDQIIGIGDIVDRGPDTTGVLDFFRRTPNARSLMGNHERKHVRAHHGEIPPAFSQIIARQQIGPANYADACAFMAGLPTFIELPEAILVHAFFEPGVAPAEQREPVLVGTLSAEAYMERRYGRPWYQSYPGAKPLIVGHHNYLRTAQPLVYRQRVFGIDTGCCYGVALTGLLLPEFRFVSVPSRRNYWAELQQQYAALRPEPDPRKTD